MTGPVLVDVKRVRSTGTYVAVLDLRASDDRDAEFPWAAECVEHGWRIEVADRRTAHREAAGPEAWCGECAELA